MYPQISPNGKQIAFINFFLNSTNNQVEMHLKVADFTENRIGKIIYEKQISQITRFFWTRDSKNLIYIEPAKKHNLIRLSLRNKKETPITTFDSKVMEGAMIFSADYKEIYAVRSFDTRELVLIKDVAKK